MSGKPYALTDLMELVDDASRSASGLPYTGEPETDAILDDPDITSRLLAHRQKFAGLSDEGRKAKLEHMLEDGELMPLERVMAELASTTPTNR